MKKILSYVLAFAMVLSLACSFSALPENRLEKAGKWGSNMPEADYHILKANAAPTIDGEFDGESVWGTPIFDITGEDAFWYTKERSSLMPLYVSWAITSSTLWTKTDGSVEMIRNASFTAYARWDDTKLYLAFVVKGISFEDQDGSYFPSNMDITNGKPVWFGNGIQVSFGPENKELTLDPAADHIVVTNPDGSESYKNQEGYVGNEYMFAITDAYSTPNTAMGILTRGKYKPVRQEATMLPELKNGRDGTAYAAQNDETQLENGGCQVYELALPFENIYCSVTQGKTDGIPFAVAFNVQGTENFEEAGFNGFQVGAGIFQQNKRLIFDSTRLMLEDSAWTCPGHTGGEHLKNCMAQAKCILCDTRYGDLGDHLYDTDDAGVSKCRYCGQCETHQFDPNVEDGKVCIICGFRQLSGDEVLIGDINGDGNINSTDGVLLKRYLAKWDISAQVKYENPAMVEVAGDCNQDNKIVSADGVLLSRYLAKWEFESKINTVVVVEK